MTQAPHRPRRGAFVMPPLGPTAKDPAAFPRRRTEGHCFLATDPARHPGTTEQVMGKTLLRHDDCHDRWQSECQRLRMYRRQYPTIARDYSQAEEAQKADSHAAHAQAVRQAKQALDRAEKLAEHIRLTVALMEAIEDEHNGHTVGTWEHSRRGPHIPVKEPA